MRYVQAPCKVTETEVITLSRSGMLKEGGILSLGGGYSCPGHSMSKGFNRLENRSYLEKQLEHGVGGRGQTPQEERDGGSE